MSKPYSTRDLQPGMEINLPGVLMFVVGVREDGIDVSWYRNGIGPHHGFLPHTDQLHGMLYTKHEQDGARKSWWDYHPDAQD